MIQTNTTIVYGDRSEKEGIIKIEVRPLETNSYGTRYLVIDWDITNISTNPVFSKEVFWTNQEIDTMDSYLEANNDFSGLTRSEKEKKKLQLALLIDTMYNLLPSGKTIYRQMPNIWELSSDVEVVNEDI